MTVVTFGSFPGGGLSEFSDTSQNGYAPYLTISPSDWVAGNYKARFSLNNASPPPYRPDSNMRMHVLGNSTISNSFLQQGTTFFKAISVRWTAPAGTALDTYAGEEIHASGAYALANGPAPGNFAGINTGRWTWLLRGASDPNSSSFIQHMYGYSGGANDGSTRFSVDWVGLSSLVTVNQWIHFFARIYFHSSTGQFELWATPHGGQMVNIVPRVTIPTCYAPPITHYPMLSMYYNNASGDHTMEYAAGAYGSNEAELRSWQATAVGYGLWSGGGDVTAPTTPGTPSVTVVSSSALNLTWTLSTDAVAVTGYKVYRGGVQIATVNSNTGAYSDTGLTASTLYSYKVAAFDAAGNTSAQSAAGTGTTSSPAADTTAPTVPTNVTALATSDTTISLTWTASTDAVGVAGYKVFRGGAQIGSTTSGQTYSDSGLTASTSYSYTVAAYDAAGNQSAQSSSSSATTSAAPVYTFDDLPAGWLGGAYVVTNSIVNGSQADKQRCSKVVVANSGTVTKIETYREPQAVAGTETSIFAVWPDNGSGTDPGSGAILGKTNPVSWTSSSPVARYSAAVITPFAVTAGQTVWVGEISGGQTNLAYQRYTVNTGAFRLMTATYSGGPLVWNTATDSTFDLEQVVWLAGTPTASSAPTNVVLPVISGSTATIVTGQAISVTNAGQWTGSPSGYTYQWQKDTAGNLTFANVSGETNSSYVTRTGDLGCNIRCVVTAINASGSVSVNTVHVGLIGSPPGRLPTNVRIISARTVNPAKRRAAQGGGG